MDFESPIWLEADVGHTLSLFSRDQLKQVLFRVRSRVMYRVPALDLLKETWFEPGADLEDFLRATVDFFHTPATMAQKQLAVKHDPDLKQWIEEMGSEYHVLLGCSQGELSRLVKVSGGTYELELTAI